MTNAPKMFLRGKRYSARVTVPKELVARFGRRDIWIKSGMSDRQAAEAVLLRKVADWKAAFVEATAQATASSPFQPPDALPQRALTEQDAARLAKTFFQRAKSRLDLDPVSAADLDGGQLEMVQDDLRERLAALGSWSDHTTHRLVDSAGHTALAGTGLEWVYPSESSERFAEYIRRALIQLHTIELARLNGDYADRVTDSFFCQGIDLAPRGGITVAPSRRTDASLGEAIDRFLSEVLDLRSVTDKTSLKHRSLLNHIGSFFDRDKPICDIERADCTRFRDTLAKLPPNFVKKQKGQSRSLDQIAEANVNGPTLAWETQNNYLKMMEDMMRWALKERLIPDNVAADIPPLKKREAAGTQRLPFRSDELTKIFAAPIFTGCVDDERGFAKPGPNVVRRSRYWLPLIALFTGMRMGEILQLTPDHVRTSRLGNPFIVLTRDMLLKTENAEREIPVHPLLQRIGFLAWVDERRRNGATELFEDVPISKHGYRSDTFTKRFATFLKKVELPANRRSKLCFHSFRHTFKDALNETGAPEGEMDEICGWSRGKKTARRYGSGLSADRLKPYVDQVTFDLDLEHLI